MKRTFGILAVSLAVAGIATLATPHSTWAAYKVTDVANGGTISGKVLLGSAKKESKSYTISKDPDACGTGNREVPFVRANGPALRDAVVYLLKVKEGKAFESGLKKTTINQEKCQFMPYLSVMENGGVLEAINSDSVLHNIHTYELIGRARRTVMNVSQPEKGNIVTKKVKLRKGAGMKVECDAHDFMHAFVFVAKNPYYAVVDDKGQFEIKGVPEGKYKINSWHGVLGDQKGTVTVTAGGTVNVDFSY